MEAEQIPYQGGVSEGQISRFAKDNLPNFSFRIETIEEMEEFL
jgi:hypothetical protein